jgi:hypothetical protein
MSVLAANDRAIRAAVKSANSKIGSGAIANDAAVFGAIIKVANAEAAVTASGNVDSGFAIAIDWGERTVVEDNGATPSDLDLACKVDMFNEDGCGVDCEAINRCGCPISKGTRDGDGDEPEKDSDANRSETLENDEDICQTIREIGFFSEALKKPGWWFRPLRLLQRHAHRMTIVTVNEVFLWE